MTSSHGVIQGYNGLAVVDSHAQIVVHAEAHGSGYEAHLLAPLIEATRKGFAELDLDQDVFADVKVTADSGDEAIHTSWSEEGERAVEALHDGAQHREGGRRGTAVVAQRGPAGPAHGQRGVSHPQSADRPKPTHFHWKV
jgi:hypothetical protein